MKLISLKCPSCGSKLDVNSELNSYTCNFCGTTTLLDDEKSKTVNITSKLQNGLNEIKEYYDNKNYRKAYFIAASLLREYPGNKELRNYHEKLNKILYKSIQYENAMGLIDYMKVNGISEKNLQSLKEYCDLFPDDEELNNYYKTFNNRFHPLSWTNIQVPGWTIVLAVSLVVITVLFLCILIMYANSL